MLQVRHLVKKYTTKGGTVDALNDVSIDFPEKGMVFLLGKSGSGKSTLLNVSGGLDTPDSGEVIVKGRSSKNFSKSDFDSYRNTYVGFIFQEYNILNELTVAENIALAIELQGKACDRERVDELLEQVDLLEYGDRKPNTLSGGQKQRVAIARALVKNPEIIMGDEPTGALDSATGKQVFDTLKKLSEDKLVVIVSHDREFAESYADRIIELSDGKIVSDMTRGGTAEERENLTELTDKKLCVSCGAALTDEDEKRILAFLKKNKGSVVITSEKEDVGELAAEHGGEHGVFGNTVITESAPAKDEAKFIKSSFPMRYAVKMGIAGLKTKPLRLIFTTLLATVAFIVFGVFSTLVTYDTATLGANTLNESAYSAAVLQKYGVLHMKNGETEYTTKFYTGLQSSHFSDSEIEALNEEYPDMNFIPAYNLNLSSLSFLSSQNHSDSSADSSYYGQISKFTAFADASYIEDYLNDSDGGVMTLLAGEFPENQSQCLISKTVYEAYAHYGYVDPDSTGTWTISDYDDIVGKQIRILGNGSSWIYMYIVGVVDTYEDFSDYDVLKSDNTDMTTTEWNALEDEFKEVFTYSMASLCFVGEGFYENNSQHDLYVNGNLSSSRLITAIRNQYFNYSNYFTAGNNLFEYTINGEAEASGSYVQYLFASLNENRSHKCKILGALDALENEELDINYEAPYSFMSDIRSSEDTLQQIYIILGSAAAVLAVFAALLLFNFISASINAKKKDIGILRAVGARGIDVFKIFIIEGIAITMFCFLLGALGSYLACTVTNGVLIANAVLSFKLFWFGGWNILILLAIAFVTAFVATAIPVAITVHKKPVEAIRAI